MKKFSTLPYLFLIAVWFLSFSAQAQDNDEIISDKEKQAVITAVGKLMEDEYVFPEVGKEMSEKLKKNLKKGSYKKIDNTIEFEEALTKDLQSISKDKHIRVIFDPQGIADQQQAISPEDKQKLKDESIANNSMGNFGFQEVKILDGNVGYLDLRSFQDTAYAGETAVAAMNFLSNSDALIIDLRQNGGGSPQMIQLISSYLFSEEPIHLNNFYYRPNDTHTQTWTLPHVSGKRYPDIPVYVLTSNRTFSAAEEFSYNLKNLERATLVGETTGGGAHPGGIRIATDRYLVWVPNGRAINPISKTNWEGTGVSPHIEVNQADAFSTAYLKAMESLDETSDNESKKAVYRWVIEGLAAAGNDFKVSQPTLQSYVGSYGPRVINFENNELYYQRGEGTKYKLIPLSEHLFSIKEIPYLRIKFENQNDQITALIASYNDGTNDKNNKD